MVDSALDDDVDRLVEQLSRTVEAAGCSVATAESLTGGQLAAAIAAAPEAGVWYRGGIVAYHPEVKYTLLETPRGPVVTPETARAMASSTIQLLGADYSVGLTGVGGPEPQEGKPPGTVHIATCARGEEPIAEHHRFSGDPVEVMERSIVTALAALIARISG